MKKHTLSKLLLVTFILACSLSAASAVEVQDHSKHMPAQGGKMQSPNGGRIVKVVTPHFEFLVQADRIAQITFLDDAGQAIPCSGQKIALVGGERSAPVTVDFVEKGGILVAEHALPDMSNMPVVLQIKVSPDSKTVREKFYLNTNYCGSCSNQEYACICGH